MHITFEKFVLRKWQPGDERSLAVHANNYNVWINLRDIFPYPYRMRDAREWVRCASSQKPVTNFAIVVNGQAVGGIGLTLKSDIYFKSAEIGYWLGEPYWNQGIVTEAVKMVTDYGFSQFDLCRISAGIMEWNPASGRVLEKCGYTLEARLKKNITKAGKTIDELVYAMVRCQ
jgi:RimJ/RimL family protein N-acetyltransferase